MTPRKPEVFPASYSSELLGIAHSDFQDARDLHGLATTRRQENIVYLAVQSMEKAMKAVLVARKEAVPFTHSLAFLAGRLSADTQVPFSEGLAKFEPFSTLLRYQNGPRPASWEEAREALDVAQAVLDWADAVVASNPH
jgi:HEPN domain-containing protein